MRICFNTILSSQWKTIYTCKIESGVIKGMQQEKAEKKIDTTAFSEGH